MPPTIATELTSRRFGMLIVLRRDVGQDPKRAYWLCRCDCGATAVKMGKYLLNGDTRSCGCEQRANRARGHVKHGAAHVGAHTVEYRAWRNAKGRCFTKSTSNYRHYGGRGITMSARWRDDFPAFLADMGPCPAGHTLDRIESNGHYEPDNCRWATNETQHNNTRANVRYPFDGESLTLAVIARRVGVKYTTLYHRINRDGLSLEEAVARK